MVIHKPPGFCTTYPWTRVRVPAGTGTGQAGDTRGLPQQALSSCGPFHIWQLLLNLASNVSLVWIAWPILNIGNRVCRAVWTILNIKVTTIGKRGEFSRNCAGSILSDRSSDTRTFEHEHVPENLNLTLHKPINQQPAMSLCRTVPPKRAKRTAFGTRWILNLQRPFNEKQRTIDMKFINALTSFLVAFNGLAFDFLVQATPLSRRDVIAPRIITPDAGTVWTIGQVETVTWWVANELHCRRTICWWGHCIIYSRDTSNFPPDSRITNPIGQVILGYLDNSPSLHLDFGVFLFVLLSISTVCIIAHFV